MFEADITPLFQGKGIANRQWRMKGNASLNLRVVLTAGESN